MQKAHNTDNHPACSTVNSRKRGLARFSVRRFLYSSLLVIRRIARNPSGNIKYVKKLDGVGSASFRDAGKGEGVIRCSGISDSIAVVQEDGQTTSKVSAFGIGAGKSGDAGSIECPLCFTELPLEYFPELSTCSHRSCYDCFQQYLRIEIFESRVCIACPECPEPMHPSDIRMILNDQVQYEKYEDFMVRRVLAVDPDTRWCPAPDCSFAVIATGCASCPRIKCERPDCNDYFCYHCKGEWHPNQTCDVARAQRLSNIFSKDSQHRATVKPCPRCQVLIVKMDDGSCNHMACAVCGTEFCWLCMREISDVHFLSPSGCTFWGKKPWSRKKKILWQLGTLVGAPVGLCLAAAIAVPAMIIGIPLWMGRRQYIRYEHASRPKRIWMVASGVTMFVLVSPLLAGLAVGVAVPALLCYVCGVVPALLCRGSSGVSTAGSDVSSNFGVVDASNTDASSIDAVSHRGRNPSIGDISLSLGSGSHLEGLHPKNDKESTSNVSLVGASITDSIASSVLPGGQRLEVQTDEASTQIFSMSTETASSLPGKFALIADGGAASICASAGSVLSFKTDSSSLSGYRGTENDACTPIEMHTDSASQRSDEATGPASLSSLKELATRMVQRTLKRPFLDQQASVSNSWIACDEYRGSETVRFDDHVSFIAPHSYDTQCKKEGSERNDDARCRKEVCSREDPSDSAACSKTAEKKCITPGAKPVDDCAPAVEVEDNLDTDSLTAKSTVSAPSISTVTDPFYIENSISSVKNSHGDSMRNVSFFHATSSESKPTEAVRSIGETDSRQALPLSVTPDTPSRCGSSFKVELLSESE